MDLNIFEETMKNVTFDNTITGELKKSNLQEEINKIKERSGKPFKQAEYGLLEQNKSGQVE